MENRVKNALRDNPSIGSMVDYIITNSTPNGAMDMASNCWEYPPHIAVQVVLELERSGREDLANMFANACVDLFIEKRDE